MDFREWILRISVNGSYGFPRMHPTKFVAKSVNFNVFSTFPFFESALMLPRTDQIRLVCISVRGCWSISLLSLFQVTYCSSRWFAKLGPFPAATIDFSPLFSDLPRKRPPPTIFVSSLSPACYEAVQPKQKSTFIFHLDYLDLFRMIKFDLDV